MDNKYKVGIIGTGYIYDAHAKALKQCERAELVAVFDSNEARAIDAAKRYGVPNVCSSLSELLALDIDAIHILTPPDSHFNLAIDVINAGHHVFLEKPMGVSSDECQQLLDAAKNKQVKVAVNHNFLFLRSYERLRGHAKDGTLGKLDQITINWLFAFGLIQFGPFDNWILRRPENILFEVGPHLVAFALACLE